MKIYLLIFGLILSFFAFGETGPIDTVLRLDQNVSSIPATQFQYNGQSVIPSSYARHLYQDSLRRRDRGELDEATRNPNCSNQNDKDKIAVISPEVETKLQESVEKDGWKVVFVARIGVRKDMLETSRAVDPGSIGRNRFQKDLLKIDQLIAGGGLTGESLDKIFEESSASMEGSHINAMAYVAAMGARLDENYGDSHAGRFVTAVEQYGRLARGESAGQCSDIHYAMLKAYKKITGPNAKAYLVNFQTGHDLHHTNLLIEKDGKVYIVNYGKIEEVANGGLDAIRQNGSAGHGLAYRIYSEDGDETDRMVAHIDSPMGKFLREVTRGTISYNPFESNDHSMLSLGLDNQDGIQIKTFLGELGSGDVIMGIAVNLEGKTKLPAGFSLEHHFSSALAYAHKNFRVDNKKEQLHSEILYINTGLGLVAPELKSGDFTFSARTDIALEGGAWIKQYSAMEDGDSHFEGDGNIVSRTKLTVKYNPNEKVEVALSSELELMPSYITAFPKAADGSSGTDGLFETMSVLPNRLTNNLNIKYGTIDGVNVFLGLTHQMIQIDGGVGHLGKATLGTSYQNFRASAFIQGALDEKTPIFMPGARRDIGFGVNWCDCLNADDSTSICLGAQVRKSLENDFWSGNTTAEVRF